MTARSEIPPFTVRVSSGIDLQVLDWPRDRTPKGAGAAVLLHGLGDGAHVWNHFAPLLAERSSLRVLAPDLRGHGCSGWDAGQDYSAQAMAGDIRDLIETLGLRNVVLIGHSLGGEVCVNLATRWKERIAGLVLVDIGPTMNRRNTSQLRAEMRRGPACFESVADYLSYLQWVRPLADPSILERMAAADLYQRDDGRFLVRLDPAALRGSRRGFGQSSEAPDSPRKQAWVQLENCDCPILLVRGGLSSLLTLQAARDFVDRLPPGAELRVVQKAGHNVMIDKPESFSDAVISFLEAQELLSSCETESAESPAGDSQRSPVE